MSDRPDEPLIVLVRGRVAYQDDQRLAAHISNLADQTALRLQAIADQRVGDQLWVYDNLHTLMRLLAHLAGQQVRDRERIEALEQALTVSIDGQPGHLVQFQQFAHEIRNDMGALNSETYGPLMDRITTIQTTLRATIEELKRAQQAIIVLNERFEPGDHADTVGDRHP